MSQFPRSAGVLCHVTSLPTPWGSGDLGQASHRYIDWLADCGMSIWQVLPLGPPGYGESPYQSFSSFAMNTMLIGFDRLEHGRLTRDELAAAEVSASQKVDFEHVRPTREHLIDRLFDQFDASPTAAEQAEFEAFQHANQAWLNDYSLFAALKASHGGRPWTDWEPELCQRQPEALKAAAEKLSREVKREAYAQFLLHQQWQSVKTHAREVGVRIMGDIPIFVAHDSADVWANQHLFFLDEHGRPTVVAGVPPDYFSATGQYWGNPLYRWDRMAEDGYAWWVERLKHTLTQVDMVRLDHFRGFEAYWEIPATAPTAASGRWVSGPGAKFFEAIRSKLGELPLVAEDLGLITKEVDALRDQFNFPGMRILQFAFGNDDKATEYLPHNYPLNCVVYTGTHDNDTAVGWFNSEPGEGTTRTLREIEEERAFTLRYLGTDGHQIHWDLIRLALSSVADTAIVPMQDILGLGTEARMNLPGTASGNWGWRFSWNLLDAAATQQLKEMTSLFTRAPRPVGLR